MSRIAELQNDIKKLEKIKDLYESTSDFLSANFYNEFMKVVNEQIQELQKVIDQ